MATIKIDNPGNSVNKDTNGGYGTVTYIPLDNDKSVDKKDKTAIPEAQPVIKKEAVVSTSTPVGKKIAEAFDLADGQEIKQHFFKDVVIPGIKRSTLEILDYIFFRGSKSSSSWGSSGYTSYGNYSSGYYTPYSYTTYPTKPVNGPVQPVNSQPVVNSKVDYRNIIVRSLPEAQDLVRSMRERISAFGYCSIADMFRMLQISSDYPDLNWGWTKPDSIDIRRASNGFLIYVTEAEYLGN